MARPILVRRAFTLIELLVVIAIIAILAAILFPVFAQARGKARQISGLSNIKQMALAVLQYVQDYDEKWPRSGYGGLTNADNAAIPVDAPNQYGGLDWQNTVMPYVKNGQVFSSPGDPNTGGAGWAAGEKQFKFTNGSFSMMYNDLLAHSAPSGPAGYADEGKQDPVSSGTSLAYVNNPSDCVLLMEGHGGWDKQGGKTPIPDWTGSTVNCDNTANACNKWMLEHTISGNFTCFFAPKGYDGTNVIGGVPFYNNGVNVSFTDGHAKYVKTSDTNGNPILCSSLPWAKHIDPQARRGDETANYCGGDNPLPGGWTGHQWY